MSDVGRVTESPNTVNGAAGQSVVGGGSVIDTDSHRRQVNLTQKGLDYQIELKNKLLKSKRTEFQENKKQIILLKGVQIFEFGRKNFDRHRLF
ncbi:hypothetical protein SNE40_013211 [Patella caerulea]|uniref:Uncharacterized protein n=1 Tax=Patella caerulea TaxID=87958 RepID=A0AAN8JMQ6_PATCE